MKVFIGAYEPQRQGGGWSFCRYLAKGLGGNFTENYDEADIMLVAGASMLKPEEAERAKADGKRIVLRCDNALRHSRNQGKGMARMYRMAQVADLVIYQCQWAKDYLGDFLGNPESVIIYNGVDLDIFSPEGSKLTFDAAPIYLYASAAKGENKRWDAAWYDYQEAQKQNPRAMLLIAGQVSTPVMEHGFDFFQSERYKYIGMMTSPEAMAQVYRSANYFYAVAENDCYSNALLEALACGLEPVAISQTGGTPELLNNWAKGRDYNGIPRMVNDYIEAFHSIV